MTCGCSLARSGLYRSGPEMGCPRDLCQQGPEYRLELAGLNCMDENLEKMRGLKGWQRFLKEYLETWTETHPNDVLTWQKIHDGLWAKGCEGFAILPANVREALCLDREPYGSL